MSLAIWLTYVALVLCTAAQRLWEVARSRRHEDELRRRGAVEVAPGHFVAMRALHASWIAGCLIESWLREPPGALLASLALLVFGAGQLLRLLAMRELGGRWTVRILVLPGVAPVRSGIYRWIRHPNYLGVILEIAALPLVYGCFATAVLASLANAAVLIVRISAEESGLRWAGGHAEAFAGVAAARAEGVRAVRRSIPRPLRR